MLGKITIHEAFAGGRAAATCAGVHRCSVQGVKADAACKRLPKSSVPREAFERELAFHAAAERVVPRNVPRNVPRLLGAAELDEEYLLVTELCQPLLGLLAPPADDEAAVTMRDSAHGALAALAALHDDARIVHGDVKPAHIMFAAQGQGGGSETTAAHRRALLCDFGSAARVAVAPPPGEQDDKGDPAERPPARELLERHPWVAGG